MGDYLANVVARTLRPEESIRPRPRARFEPAAREDAPPPLEPAGPPGPPSPPSHPDQADGSGGTRLGHEPPEAGPSTIVVDVSPAPPDRRAPTSAESVESRGSDLGPPRAEPPVRLRPAPIASSGDGRSEARIGEEEGRVEEQGRSHVGNHASPVPSEDSGAAEGEAPRPGRVPPSPLVTRDRSEASSPGDRSEAAPAGSRGGAVTAPPGDPGLGPAPAARTRPPGGGDPGSERTDQQTAAASPPARLIRPVEVAQAPPRRAEEPRPSREAGPPPVRVTIGRVDVRAVSPGPPRPVRRAEPRRPALSLDDYLERRNRGRG